MPQESDARFAMLRDPDLYDLLGRIALKIVRDEAMAEDVRQGAYVVAMQLIMAGRGPRDGHERGWMCRVLKNHAYAELRRRRGEEPPVDVDADEGPDIPVEDQRTLLDQQREAERLLDAAREAARKHPDHAAQLRAGDGRKDGGGAKDAATRKRRERARTVLASAISAALAAAAVLLLVMGRQPTPTVIKPPPPFAWTDTTLAEASRRVALRRCDEKQWQACLVGLDEAKRLDPAHTGPAEQAAWQAALVGLRSEALDACGEKQWLTCIEKLDLAQQFDPGGESDARIQLARSEALGQLRGPAPAPPRHTVPPTFEMLK